MKARLMSEGARVTAPNVIADRRLFKREIEYEA
jgi:hypothetical protein